MIWTDLPVGFTSNQGYEKECFGGDWDVRNTSIKEDEKQAANEEWRGTEEVQCLDRAVHGIISQEPLVE